MRILVICQYYYPEPFRISDICEELVKRGNEVTVVTGLPNYPMGEIYDGYRNGEKRDEVIKGVKVHRCKMIPRKHGSIYRILNYFSYAHSSTKYVKRLDDDFDVVFVNQLSPVMIANAGIRYKKKHGTKLVLYCLDLWPESLVAIGIKRDSLVYRLFHHVSEKIYCQADRLLITSKSFADYFENEFGIIDTVYLPQYAELLFTPEQCRKEPNGVIDLMFAGNVGIVQSVITIINAAKLTSETSNIHWHIVGDGIELDALKKQADGLDDVIFHGRKPLEDMPMYYSMADAMLVTMVNNKTLSKTLPGKVQTYMAAGKPIIGAADGETFNVLQEACCGLCVNACDERGLANAALDFSRNQLKWKMYQENSQTFYNQHFTKDLFMSQLQKELSNSLK